MDDVLAAWEQGSAAFGRADEDSDVDLSIVVRDDAVVRVVAMVEAALARAQLVPDLRYEVPQPSWHGHWQAFYRFAGLPPLLLLDMAVIKVSSASWLNEPEVHGWRSRIIVDREKKLDARRLDRAAHVAALGRARDRLVTTTELFHPFVEKEMRRGRAVDALHFYNSLVLARLVEALRMLHCPQRSTFGMRYVREDLPMAAATRLEKLAFVSGPAALVDRKTEALAWLRETLDAVGELDLGKHLDAAIERESVGKPAGR